MGYLSILVMQVGATGFGLRVDRLFEVVPLKEIENVTALVLFDEAHYTEALQQAQQLRAQQKRVTMQSTAGLLDVEAYKKQFKEVVFIGQEE